MRVHKFQKGDVQFVSLEEANKVHPLKNEFPKEHQLAALLAHREHGATEDNVEIGFNYLYAEINGNKILIDAGKGMGQLVEALKIAGIDPMEIDYLIITHGDNDHMGGIHHFTKSTVVMPDAAYKIWVNEESRNELIGNAHKALVRIFPEKMMALGNAAKVEFATEVLSSLGSRLLLVQDEDEFIKGVKLFPTPGHREDHYAVEIKTGEDEDDKIIVLADAIRHGFQMKYNTLNTYFDSIPEEWTSTLKNIAARDPEKKFVYFGTHITFPGLLKYNEKGLLVKWENI